MYTGLSLFGLEQTESLCTCARTQYIIYNFSLGPYQKLRAVIERALFRQFFLLPPSFPAFRNPFH